jgi:hypothetical protein
VTTPQSYLYKMLLSISVNSGIRPEDLLAGLTTATATVTAGVGASIVSERTAEKLQAERLKSAELLLVLSRDLGPGTHQLQHLQIDEMKARFKEARIYQLLFSLMISLFALLFILGGISLVLGITTAHVVTVLASAIPGVGSVLFKYASNVAIKRSDEAFQALSKRVESAEAAERREFALSRIQRLGAGDTLEALEAIKSIVPDATPDQLASILKDLPAITTTHEMASEQSSS